MRRTVALFLLVATASCNVDALLESEVAPDIRLTMAASANLLSLTPGNTGTVTVTVTRLGDYTGPVSFELTGVPSGVSATIGNPTTAERITATTVTFSASSGAAIGDFTVSVRGTGTPNGLAVSYVTLRIVPRPAVGVAPARQSLTIIRGGISPLTVAIARTNFAGGVGLSLTGAAGIALASTDAITGSTASVTVSVAPTVTPGTYTLALRATSATGDDADAGETPLTVVVPTDALQVLAGDAATSQAAAITQPVIINRNGVTAPVTISAEGLPAGVGMTMIGGPTAASSASVRITVGTNVAPGAYNVRLHAQAPGVPEVTGDFLLTIAASNVAMTLVPQNVTMLQGSSASSVLTIVRTSYAGPVAVEVLDVPTGITVAGAGGSITGNSATLVVQAGNGVTPGLYPVRVRVIPSPVEVDAPALDPVTTTLSVTVVEAPPFAGNVLLDWSRCAAPEWVVAKNGTGPWTRLTGTNGRFSFALTSPRGAFAYDDGGAQVVVRYGTGSELAAAPIDLCPPPSFTTHSVTGTAQHASATEQFTWRLGGGVGTSTLATPNFTITGVRDGATHDLIGWGVTQALSTRIFIQRDVNEPAGGFVGTTTLTGLGSFSPLSGLILIPGFAGEQMGTTMSYLTTGACTENELNSTSAASVSGTLNLLAFGVPTLYQRPNDYHNLLVTARTTGAIRSVNLSFKQMLTSTRTVSLPAQVFPSVTAVAGAETKRLRLVLGAIPSGYNGSVTLRYSDGSRGASVTASVATFSPGVAVLEMPDLSGVPGFNPASTVSAAASGTWTVVLDGSTGERTKCADGASSWSVTRTGSF